MSRTQIDFQIRSVQASGGPVRFSGYGSVFDTVDSYGDTISKGAFAKSLAEWRAKGRLPKMLLQHGGGWCGSAEDRTPIGKWSVMREDDHGLYCEGELFDADTPNTRIATVALRAGELDGLSIGFLSRAATIDDKTGIRTLTEIDLFEVSLVTFPANDPARVTTVRSLSRLVQLQRAIDTYGESRRQQQQEIFGLLCLAERRRAADLLSRMV